MAARSYGQHCGVTTAVELIGERWALLIVRDLLVGPRRYTDLKAGLPKIPTNILSARLKELQAAGVIRRVPVFRTGLVYELTDYGRELEPIVLALGRWGFRAMGDPGEGDEVTADALTVGLRSAFRPEVAATLPDTDYELRIDAVALRVQVAGETLAVTQVSPALPPVGGALPAADPDVTIVASAGFRRVVSGEVAPQTALDDGLLAVERGDATLLERFAATFHIDSTGPVA